jgi:hypothetical protein
MAPPVGFSDAQLETVLIAAAALPRERRDGFLRTVSARLSAQPSDADVVARITAALRARGQGQGSARPY